MKKALLVAAIAATLAGPSLAGSPAFADPLVVAQSSETMTSPLLGSMDTLHKQMSAMKMSGSTDKDYMTYMKMLVGAMKSATQAEMKAGKDRQSKETAEQVYKRLFQSDPLDGTFGANR
ncbi:MAG TPA: hypothetical protein VN603_06065 [Candidatus Acidoferrales bacterium]|nr:hypothetical protein [Candidatus Acidoferrales bacterium]